MAAARVLFGAGACALSCRLVAEDTVSARLEWEDAYRRLAETASDAGAEEALRIQLEAVTDELRRRVGGTFALAELVDEYASADAWVRAALAELAVPGWPRTLALVEGAAFHVYSRGATDYEP